MGIKDWFIEKDEPEEILVISGDDCSPEEYVEEVEVKNTALDGLVENIYAENDLSDKSDSIFKVLEAIEALPAEMPVAQKVASVISILKISGLNEIDVTTDAETRLGVLRGALVHINNKYADEVAKTETEIAALEQTIAEKQQYIYETKITDEQSTKIINDEIGTIEGLVKFLGKEVN